LVVLHLHHVQYITPIGARNWTGHLTSRSALTEHLITVYPWPHGLKNCMFWVGLHHHHVQYITPIGAGNWTGDFASRISLTKHLVTIYPRPMHKLTEILYLNTYLLDQWMIRIMELITIFMVISFYHIHRE